jgi:hypothetical protein
MEIVRRDAPPEDLQRRDAKGPRFDWLWMSNDGEKALNDEAMGEYLGSLLRLSYDEIVAPAETRPQPFAQPALTIALQFDDGATDVLTIGERAPDGRSRIWNGTTGQVFLVSPGKALALAPNVKALLQPRKIPSRPATRPASSPTSR